MAFPIKTKAQHTASAASKVGRATAQFRVAGPQYRPFRDIALNFMASQTAQLRSLADLVGVTWGVTWE